MMRIDWDNVEQDEKERIELANRFGLSIITDLSEYPFVRDKIKKVPYAFAKNKLALPLNQDEDKILVAIADPADLTTIEELRLLLGAETIEVFCPRAELEAAIELCYHQHEKDTSQFIAGLKGNKEAFASGEEEDGYDLFDQKTDSPVIRMLNMILTDAIQQAASDIHFEPLENKMLIRFRIDGVLQLRHSPPLELQNQLITRIKVMAKLDIAEYRLPQDGRIKLKMAGREIDFRVSTVPVVFGERIVLRILDKSNVLLGLDKLGMPASIAATFTKHIHQNQGIVLVTGPTGSGKTTTLYSSISDINSTEVNIMTIEDPVEIKLPGTAQIGVNPKINLYFSTGLRHILRQDPDVIMIGEIRDKETAEIAIQSSLTGHLVLSTLHTNDAPSALTRLVDMGIEPYLLSSSILAVLAQRLLRMICLSCKQTYVPTDQELCDLGVERGSLNENHLCRGTGCDVCFDTGYKGRHGIYELMSLTSPIKEQLLKSADAGLLQRVALKEGMVSLRQAGSQLAIAGVTTSEEVLRVTKEGG